jgi:transposase InsO family protein
MPWKVTDPMNEKQRFVLLAQTGRITISDLCKDFGISRKTGHKYLLRYAAGGMEGLREKSRRPERFRTPTDKEVERLVLLEKRKHPNWGPLKVRRLLTTIHGIESPPHVNTVGRILDRNGLVKRRKRKKGVYRVRPENLTQPDHPNHVWTFDFKGWFLLGDGTRCDPLTVCDRFSRYILAFKACPNQQYNTTFAACKKLMRYHGLPEIIRVDNGSPFASNALGGLSQLSVWWVEQGIRVEFTRPGKPGDNGSHERMHRDSKAEATTPPSSNLPAQDKRFSRWSHEYNHVRPHESLDMLCPADFYHKSQRRLGETDKWRYPEDYLLKRVAASGHISWLGHAFYISEVYKGCEVALYENKEGVTELHYANLHLGNFEFDPKRTWDGKPKVIRAPDLPSWPKPLQGGKE